MLVISKDTFRREDESDEKEKKKKNKEPLAKKCRATYRTKI